MSKKPPIGPEYSRDREFGAILEDLKSDFRAFGEGLENVTEKVDRIEQDVHELKSDVSLLKVAVSSLSADVVSLKKDVSSLKTDVSGIKIILPTLATKSDLQQLEKRLTAVESH